MHIAKHGAVTRSINASFWGNDYATYTLRDGVVIARGSDDKTLFLQGDEAEKLLRDLDAAVVAFEAFGKDDVEAIDDVLGEYEAIENWDAFEVTRCAPSSDLGLLNYYA